MATLQELMAQKEAIEKQIEQTKTQGRREAIDQVRALMREYGLSAADLSGRKGSAQATPRKTKASAGKKVAAKYRNASTGESWSGRGLQPRWLKAAIAGGKKLTDFAL
ncbi:MAG: H-NS histone family protein [Pseudomonadota bacterium]|nr:H-NS histone family protein [Pseudomonadota bacterium]